MRLTWRRSRRISSRGILAGGAGRLGMDRSETARYHWPAWESGFKQLVNMNQNKALKKKATPANEASPGPREEFCSNCRQTLWMLSSLWKRKFFWPSLFLELLLALSLSVAYYFLVKNYSMGPSTTAPISGSSARVPFQIFTWSNSAMFGRGGCRACCCPAHCLTSW